MRRVEFIDLGFFCVAVFSSFHRTRFHCPILSSFHFGSLSHSHWHQILVSEPFSTIL
jgi:hypothetical protein